MKKYLISILLFTIFSLPIVVKAQSSIPCYPNPSVGCIKDANKDAELNQTLHLDGSGTYSMGVAITAIADSILTAPNSDGTISQRDLQRSLAGQIVRGVNLAYTTPPANLALWIDETGQNLGFIPKTTYAQSAGFSALSPILNVWRAFRNVSYVLLAGALIFIGFMVMFRKRIDPHTVVTVQNAIPRVIITLILITFSYAIAALLLELMYLSLYIIVALISSGFGNNFEDLANIYINQGDAFSLLGRMMSPLNDVEGGTGALASIIGGIGGSILTGGSAPGAVLGAILGLVASGAGTVLGGGGDFGTGFVTPVLWLIFAVVIFFFFFRVLFMLIGAYIQILLGIITAPLQILLNVFPGNNAFQSWLMTLIGNLGTFVVVASMLMITGAIISNIDATGVMWAPPLVGGVNANFIKLFIGVGGIMLIPSMVNSFKQMLQAGSGLAAGGAAAGSIGGSVGSLMQIVHLGTSIDHLTGGRLAKRIPGLGGGDDHGAKP